jgi:hypothetical protein
MDAMGCVDEMMSCQSRGRAVGDRDGERDWDWIGLGMRRGQQSGRIG